MILSTLTKSQTTLIKNLQLKKHRDEQDLFVLEGEKSVVELIINKGFIKYLICTEDFLEKYYFEIEKLDSKVSIVNKDRLATLGTFQTNNAALAVAHKLDYIDCKNNLPTLAIDSVRDPGNFGTIVRTAHWFGIKNIICSMDTVDLYNSKVLQACMGSFLHVNIFYTDLETFFKKTDLPIFGTSMDGENIFETTIPKKSIIVIGNESHGINENLQSFFHKNLTIPQYSENIDSLNASVATGIICGCWCKK